MANCINCGTQLSSALVCENCGMATVGARQEETTVEVFVDRPVQTPAICCCCLAPKEQDVQQQVYVSYREFIRVPVPWCKSCKQRQLFSLLTLLSAMFLVGVPLMALPIAVWGRGNLGYGLGTAGFILGLIVGAVVGVKLRKLWQRPGHAPGCDAVGSLQGEGMTGPRRGGRLRFINRVFAQEWIRHNPG